jgi:hypothetical protein
MHKRSSKQPRYSADVNVLAYRIVQSIADIDIGKKNPAAVALGRLGGRRGGKARAEKLSPEKRREIAQNAALARWKKEPNDK